MTWDFLILIALVIILGIYLVFMSMWWHDDTLRFRHFVGLWALVIFCIVQAISV